ncbi:MAG: hypothetical protein SFU25_11335 [Candidatus Caenarcaniphilales bacterium]|nr:hypothetical protein [Candidatus Caenarcaniphilales bacterium]
MKVTLNSTKIATKEVVKPVQTAKTTDKNISKEGPINFFRNLFILAKTPAEERKIPNPHLWTALINLTLSIPSIGTLLCANFLKDPDSKMPPSDSFWNKFLEICGKAYQPLFEIITISNFLISLLRISPSRNITYGALSIYNLFAWHEDWQMIDNTQEIRKIKQEIKVQKELLSSNSYKLSEAERTQILYQISQLESKLNSLKHKTSELHSKMGFMGRVIYNWLMCFSFLYYLPEIAGSCRFGEMPEGKAGKYTGRIPSGNTIKDLLKGFKGNDEIHTTESYWKEWKKRLWQEFVGCPSGIVRECFEDFVDPTKALGNKVRIEDVVKRETESIQNPAWKVIRSWSIRLSKGPTTSLLNLGNAGIRFSIPIFALIALAQLGINVFNRNSPYDLNTELEDFQQDRANPLGKVSLNTSNSLVTISRFLSGWSGLMIAFDPFFQINSGPASMWSQGIGGGLSLISAVVGQIPGLSTMDLTFQFASSLFLFNSASLFNLYQGMKKNGGLFERKIYNKGLTQVAAL